MPIIPEFSWDPALPGTGETVQFTDLSSATFPHGPIDTWEWDFQDDGTVDSTAQNPTYTFTTPGTYTVRLTSGSGGGSVTEDITHEIEVTPGPGGGSDINAELADTEDTDTLSSDGDVIYPDIAAAVDLSESDDTILSTIDDGGIAASLTATEDTDYADADIPPPENYATINWQELDDLSSELDVEGTVTQIVLDCCCTCCPPYGWPSEGFCISVRDATGPYFEPVSSSNPYGHPFGLSGVKLRAAKLPAPPYTPIANECYWFAGYRVSVAQTTLGGEPVAWYLDAFKPLAMRMVFSCNLPNKPGYNSNYPAGCLLPVGSAGAGIGHQGNLNLYWSPNTPLNFGGYGLVYFRLTGTPNLSGGYINADVAVTAFNSATKTQTIRIDFLEPFTNQAHQFFMDISPLPCSYQPFYDHLAWVSPDGFNRIIGAPYWNTNPFSPDWPLSKFLCIGANGQPCVGRVTALNEVEWISKLGFSDGCWSYEIPTASFACYDKVYVVMRGTSVIGGGLFGTTLKARFFAQSFNQNCNAVGTGTDILDTNEPPGVLLLEYPMTKPTDYQVFSGALETDVSAFPGGCGFTGHASAIPVPDKWVVSR